MQNIDFDIEYDSEEEVYENEKFMNIYLNKDDKDKWKTNIDYEYKTERALKSDKSRFKNTTGGMENITMDVKDDWKSNVDYEYKTNKTMNIKYDDIVDKTEENKKYINDTDNWKYIYDSEKY